MAIIKKNNASRLIIILLALIISGCNIKTDLPQQDIEPAPNPGEVINRLLNDEELRTDEDNDAAQVDDRWATWIQSNYSKLRSVTYTGDFSDLQFLKNRLEGRRIVQLGESGHGVRQFNQVKVRLIKFLHQEMDFDVVTFETDLFGCYFSYNRAGILSSERLMKDSLYTIWHTEGNIELFDYIKASRNSARPLFLAGFDMKPSSGVYRNRPAFLRDCVAPLDGAYAQQVYNQDLKLVTEYSKGDVDSLNHYFASRKDELYSFYTGLADYIQTNMDTLKSYFSDRPEVPVIARQTARSLAFRVLKHYYEFREPNGYTSWYYRDLAMAENLRVLAEEVFPGKKIIVWAHNYHIRHNNADITSYSRERAMGSWIVEQYRPELYTIGLYMYRGRAAWSDRIPYSIKPPSQNSLEAVLYQTRSKYVFVDMLDREQNEDNSWMFQQIKAKRWGYFTLYLVPRRQYDGVIFIDTVEPPIYK